MTIYFTADLHLNHENVIKHSNRPFSNLEDMDDGICFRWNSVVKRCDTVYCLGDFALSWGKRSVERIDTLLARLNGSKHLIVGNHDRAEVTRNKRWQTVEHYKEIKVDTGDVHKQRIVMCHYAMRTWNQMHRGSIMLHGHSHGNLSDIGGRIMDVGVDCHDYRPISLETVLDKMRDRSFVSEDYHE